MLDHTLTESEQASGLCCVMLRISHKYCNLHLCDISMQFHVTQETCEQCVCTHFPHQKEGSLRLAPLTFIATLVTGEE
jgi:hypothetical protein